MFGSVLDGVALALSTAIAVTVFVLLVLFPGSRVVPTGQRSGDRPLETGASTLHPAVLGYGPVIGWAALFLVGVPVVLHDRLGVWSPFAVLWLFADFCRLDAEPGPVNERHQSKERDEDSEMFLGPVLMTVAPLTAPLYAIVALVEYALRRGVASVAGVGPGSLPSVPTVAARWLVALLAAIPILAVLADEYHRRTGNDDWLEATPADGVLGRTWLATRPGRLRTIFVVSLAVVPAVLVAELGAYSPIVVALLGIGPVALAVDPHCVGRRTINYALFVPVTVPVAVLELELRLLLG